uniref:Uncharacterized protein n=1 Tax=Eutreptiella gymnastica TaxID=73025 RepID=A0A7S4LFG9_9EUGL
MSNLIPEGNGGGQHQNQYTIRLLVVVQGARSWLPATLLKVGDVLVLEVQSGNVIVDALAPKYGDSNGMQDNFEWSYVQNSRTIHFSQQQTDVLEKEYQKNAQGNIQLQMDKKLSFCNLAQMKLCLLGAT